MAIRGNKNFFSSNYLSISPSLSLSLSLSLSIYYLFSLLSSIHTHTHTHTHICTSLREHAILLFVYFIFFHSPSFSLYIPSISIYGITIGILSISYTSISQLLLLVLYNINTFFVVGMLRTTCRDTILYINNVDK